MHQHCTGFCSALSCHDTSIHRPSEVLQYTYTVSKLPQHSDTMLQQHNHIRKYAVPPDHTPAEGSHTGDQVSEHKHLPRRPTRKLHLPPSRAPREDLRVHHERRASDHNRSLLLQTLQHLQCSRRRISPQRARLRALVDVSKKHVAILALPQLLHSRRASLVFLRTTTLQIPADNILSQSPLHDFVASFAGDSGYKSVRRIAFTGTEEIEYSADSARHVYPSSEVATSVTSKGLWNDPHHLVMKCTGLRELEFKDLLAGEFYNEDKLDHDALRSFRHLFDRYGPMRVRCRTSWSDFIVEGHEITPSVRLMLILAVPEFLDQSNGDKGYLAFLGALSKEGRERGSGVRIEVEMRVIPQSGAAFS
jgi:hypothetical protein